MSFEVLVFQIENIRFGIRASDVVEVVHAVKLSPVPRAVSVVEGLLNLRGRVVPVVDLRRVLGLSPRAIKHTDHLLVVRRDDQVVTFRADRAVGLVHLEDSDIEAAREMIAAELVEVVGKTEDGIVHVLDVGQLVSLGDARLATGFGRSASKGPAP
jgi:purine-binding chemotaxis protein CheW